MEVVAGEKSPSIKDLVSSDLRHLLSHPSGESRDASGSTVSLQQMSDQLLLLMDAKRFAVGYVLHQALLECHFRSWQAKNAVQSKDQLRVELEQQKNQLLIELEQHKAQSDAQMTELQQTIADLSSQLAGTLATLTKRMPFSRLAQSHIIFRWNFSSLLRVL
jgi:DNA anti-recombination protein RmuC